KIKKAVSSEWLPVYSIQMMKNRNQLLLKSLLQNRLKLQQQNLWPIKSRDKVIMKEVLHTATAMVSRKIMAMHSNSLRVLPDLAMYRHSINSHWPTRMDMESQEIRKLQWNGMRKPPGRDSPLHNEVLVMPI